MAKKSKRFWQRQSRVPATRRKKRVTRKLRKTAVVLSVLSGVAAGGYFAFAGAQSWLSALNTPPKAWELTVSRTLRESFAPNDIDALRSYVYKRLPSSSADGFEDIAMKTQRHFKLARVSLVRTGPSQLVVVAQQRRAVLRTKWLSSALPVTVDGVVFEGTADESLPLITGIISGKAARRYRFRADHSLGISARDQDILREAVNLLRTYPKEQPPITKIRFVDYRGFEVTQASSELTVMVGRKPFAKKWNNLLRLLKNLKDKDRTPFHIELDYSGKAFIKEERKS